MISSTAGGGYQPPAMTQAPIQPRKLRPARIWYLVALAVLAVGAAWLIFAIVSLASTVNGLQRVPLPAGGTVNLDHSGGYVVYYEGPGSQTGNIPSFDVHITPASHGAAVSSLTHYQSSVTYSFGSRHGRAVLSLNVAHPGRFAIVTSGPSGTGADLAVGGNIGRGIVGILIPGIPLMILAFVGGLVVFIVRIARKSALRRAQPPPPVG